MAIGRVQWRDIATPVVGLAHTVGDIPDCVPRSFVRALRIAERVGDVLARARAQLSMAGLSVFFSIRIGHVLFTPDLQTSSRIARPVVVTAPRNHDVAPNSRPRGVYDVIATRTLFHPNRSEPTRSEAITPIQPPPPTLALHGVVVSGDTRLAYLQDLVTKQIFGYKTGDKLAGGLVERIELDRVVIMRGDGPFEVMLHRPKEPLPVAPSPQEDSPRRSRGRQE